MVETWYFMLEKEGSRALVPYNEFYTIQNRNQWEGLREQVELFFASHSNEDIARLNKEAQQEYNRRFEETTAQPVPNQELSTRKHGYIYILHSELGHYKIGRAKDPFSRSRTIGTEHAHKVSLIYIALCLDYTKVERYLHRVLASYRMNGEWFDLPPDKVEWLLYHDWIDDAGLDGIVTSMERIPQ